MKTEKEIKAKLKELNAQLKPLQRRKKLEYEDEMTMCTLEGEIEGLDWALEDE